MYEKYSNSPDNVPESWRHYFEGINDNQDLVKKEVSEHHGHQKNLKIPLILIQIFMKNLFQKT